MSMNRSTAIGSRQRFVIQPQKSSETYPYFTVPNSANAGTDNVEKARILPVKSTSIDFKQLRADREDSADSRDVSERITGNKEVGWSAKSHVLIPDQSSATFPSWAGLMHSAMGGAAESGGVTFSLSQSQTANKPLTLVRLFNGASDGIMSEAIWGALAETWKLEAKNGEAPTMEWSGFASDYVFTGNTTVNDVSPTSNPFTATNGKMFGTNSVIKIGSDTVSGNIGHVVASVSGNDVTVGTAPSGVSNGDAIVPWLDSDIAVATESLINGISGSLAIASDTNVLVTAFSLDLKNNHKQYRSAFSATTQDSIAGRRKISGKISILADALSVKRIGERQNFSTLGSMVVILGGSSSGDERMTITMPYPEYEFAELQVPDGHEECVIELPFILKASTRTATDALSIALSTV